MLANPLAHLEWMTALVAATEDYIDEALCRMGGQASQSDREMFDVYPDNKECIVLRIDVALHPHGTEHEVSIPAGCLCTENGWSVWRREINRALEVFFENR